MSDLIVETILDIRRSPEAVFAFLAHTDSFKAVDAALLECEPSGQLVNGMTGRMLHRRGGMKAPTTWRVAELEAPSRIAVEIAGMGYAMTEEVDLRASPTGTRVRFFERVWSTSTAGRLLVALSGPIMRRDLRSRSARLKEILEARPDRP